ncbi:hypothetical protein A3H22_02140 [Candidatus Peribacteria bacterium RIFCSPLOWO2_12_FULL_55_15]|nr:MAG: hypothetical protein A2789_03665 [Candidatus Peribacteria bacterium RIFCSPHIGHO2_01_FULL_54_22]OGJ62952.1 MAG: hypothetical protein A3D12_04530 [Candidatus Peribacteria bacterium RIFCSPHIGHO2_02_FULL_55_24]OGJ64854.1 MAG: hypothetical protein A3E47_01675 [Candidatus Peribacteria bacterium RIFCSPHIGHO2_12_FULL_54_10]OGJ70778.1 MAG: hypothetical protein A3H22_02140 [Candidatus Peribacteria bacterium RIFCSPLOWO2_12_FULL_55_15]
MFPESARKERTLPRHRTKNFIHAIRMTSAASSPPRMSQMERFVDQSTMLLMGTIGTIILILALLILLHQNATATKGYRLRKLEREHSQLLLEEEVLRMHVADAQSLDVLQNDKKIQATIPIKKILYVNENAAMAQNH